jgi:hypothetical protein
LASQEVRAGKSWPPPQGGTFSFCGWRNEFYAERRLHPSFKGMLEINDDAPIYQIE